MRQIKFRAWCKTSIPPKMVDWETMRETTMLYEFERLAHHYDWMQFTGLLDRNGKEIYEGDFIQFSGGLMSTSEPPIYSGEVVFVHAGFVVEYKDIYGRDKINHLSEPDIEVIGNVYETPELLK